MVEFGYSADLAGPQFQIADGAVKNFMPRSDNISNVSRLQDLLLIQAVIMRHHPQHLIKSLMRRQGSGQTSNLHSLYPFCHRYI